MFYKEEDLKEILSCTKCHERLDEPRILQCHSVICSYCAKLIKIKNNKFECIVCNESHYMNDNELPISKEIKKLLDLQPVQVSRGRSYDKLEKTLQAIDSVYTQILSGIKNGSDYIEEYCSNLKNELQLAKEEHIQALEEYNQKMINEIDKYKKEKIAKLETKSDLKNDFDHLLEELKAFSIKSNICLKNNKIDDDLIDKVATDGEKLLGKAKKENNFLQCILFDRQQLVFIRNQEKLGFNKIIGKLDNQLIISSILNSKQFTELLGLCLFDIDQKWDLIYRASKHGFKASDFHSKCNNKSNTLIVIQSTNGNIFGGYTEQDWSHNGGYKSDPKAFIFSLKNIQNTPMLFQQSSFNYSICCHNIYGPKFGGGHDFVICDNSNQVNSSYSNLGSSYLIQIYSHGSDQAKSFLAGSYNFLTREIEVFTRSD